MSLKLRALRFIKNAYDDDPCSWVHKGTLEDKAREARYLASNVGRRLRELREEGLIERRVIKGSVQYRYSPQQTMEEKLGIIDQVFKANG